MEIARALVEIVMRVSDIYRDLHLDDRFLFMTRDEKNRKEMFNQSYLLSLSRISMCRARLSKEIHERTGHTLRHEIAVKTEKWIAFVILEQHGRR